MTDDHNLQAILPEPTNEPVEVSLDEFELALIRAYNGLDRWQQQSVALMSETPLSGAEGALLRIIRLHDRPKSIKELARLTNRDDIPNIQYSLRKLAAAGLVSKSGSGRTGVNYTTTQDGVRLTDEIAMNRRSQLIALLLEFGNIEADLEVGQALLNKMTSAFEETVREIAARR
ncbi:winged helix DNA-binding protein [Epibacterium sp. SM1979]|uniref:Winged helix DNA-binding protein n=1 Tax=Tritonibacter litoralis TaxID=2662264 RepID=A0A843YIT4_9RHOB|nr:winged helix DNA-binding protein [Tritonibacter litoralis]MQQ09344.1 winged helix DNA-binding protein [Tritonibacter litoralis]